MAQVTPPPVTYPGVYVQEISGFHSSVAQVETAIPAFLGYTEKANLRDKDFLFKPQRIASLKEFENMYGNKADSVNFNLHPSLQLYFQNGGNNCYIVSIGSYGNPINKNDFFKGLVAIEEMDEPTLLVFPDAVNLPGNDLYEIQNAALAQAAKLGDRFCILDLKYADNQARHDSVVAEFRVNIGPGNLKFGAVYTPHLRTAGRASEVLPSSAAIAGAYCTVDRTRGVWKAPANIMLAGVTQVLYSINASKQNDLNVDVNEGKSINAIRNFPGKGILIWGSRTLAGNDNEWRYVPVRRFFNMIEESVKKACQSFVFEPNDANTWAKVKSMIENYLTEKWREGAMQGSKPSDAFFVKVGLGETMTATDILEGRIIFEIGMAVIRPAEFVILRFSQKMAGN